MSQLDLFEAEHEYRECTGCHRVRVWVPCNMPATLCGFCEDEVQGMLSDMVDRQLRAETIDLGAWVDAHAC